MTKLKADERMLLREYPAPDNPDLIVLLAAHCPACGFEHGFRIDAEFWASVGMDVWQFDGNYACPTFVGSMLSRNPKGTRFCHSYVRNGQWEFLDDCTHELAGRTVPMIPFSSDSNVETKEMV